jgi:thiol:disulfide interchange protein DsbD
MEAITFANPEIAKEMGRFVLVQADVTVNNPSSQALLKQYGLFGPPAILLFNSFSEEQKALRIIGFMPPGRFSQRLQELNTK